MDLKAFLSSRYQSEAFERFVSERFYGFEALDSDFDDDGLNESEKKHIKAYRFLGQVELDDGKELGFFEFISKSPQIENKRVGYNTILKKLAADYLLDGAIASFYYPDGNVWRLSFVGFEYDEGRASVTNLKRFTYVLGEGIPTKTPYAQLKDLKYPKLNEIEEAFSVEAVTKDFYLAYKALFEKINEELEPQKALFTEHESDPDVGIRKFSRKLLGRITFMYFLQKKGWLGVTGKWGDGRKDFLSYHYKKCEGNFYDDILSPLFFTALNTMRVDDYYKNLDCKIPFLNGGLFTRERFDNAEVTLSNELFGDIFNTFNQYNFTIIEDLPHDSEVAIDPEMLGRVFENLIEENYRKGKGAFYTPREIVHYMCKESIIMYLSNHFDKEQMESLVNDEATDDDYIKKHATDIKDRLLQMKVLDPAIGSGAFPMGVLHEMVQIIGNLNKTDNPSKEKKLIIENSIYGVDIDGSAVDIAKLRFWLSIIVDEEEPFPLPNLAFKIMQGNSLIETIDGFSPIPEDIYEQKETKPVSLFEEEEKTLFDKSKFDLLRDNIHKFYNASDTDKKKNLEHKIKAQIQEIVCGYIDIKEEALKARTKDFDSTQKASSREKLWNEMDKLQNSIAKARNIIGDILTNNFQTTELFLYKLWFGEVIKEGGFDVIIGNPPYIQLQSAISDTEKLADIYKNHKYETFERTGDIYTLFYEKGVHLLKEKGILSFITSNKWMKTGYGKSLRKFLSRYDTFRLIDLGPDIFESATVETNILFVRNTLQDNVKVNAKILQSKKELQKLHDETYTVLEKPGEDAWVILSAVEESIKRKVDAIGTPLKEWDIKINRGVLTGYNKAFVIDEETRQKLIYEDTSNKNLIKPLLRGKDIEKYVPSSAEKWLINTHNNPPVDAPSEYPIIYKWLLQYQDRLEKRSDKGENWWNLRSCAYLNEFEKEKIVWKRIGSIIRFCYSDKGEYCLDSTVIATGRHVKYLTALLNSRLFVRELMLNAPKTGTGDVIISVQALVPLQVYQPSDAQAKPFEDFIDTIIDKKERGEPIEDIKARIDKMVYELYDLNDEEIEVIENGL